MAKKDELSGPGSALLPTVGEPGTFEWCEEVVECMNAAWRAKETAELGFFVAVRAAIQYRIWEILSPPPPEEPYDSLDRLIRQTAEPGQAENMQIAIRFSGIEAETAGRAASATEAAPVVLASDAEGETPPWETRAADQVVSAAMPGRPLTEEDEIALGNALLDQYHSQIAALGSGSGVSAAAGAPRRSAAERKRDRLERTHPELVEAVETGDLTLKQAYIQAGIDKEVRTLDKLQKLWKQAPEEERDRFLAWVDQEERWGRRHEQYEQDVYGTEQ